MRFDPKTEKFQSWAIPSGGGIVRHMVRGPDGRFGLALSGVNGVAIVEKNWTARLAQVALVEVEVLAIARARDGARGPAVKDRDDSA